MIKRKRELKEIIKNSKSDFMSDLYETLIQTKSTLESIFSLEKKLEKIKKLNDVNKKEALFDIGDALCEYIDYIFDDFSRIVLLINIIAIQYCHEDSLKEFYGINIHRLLK